MVVLKRELAASRKVSQHGPKEEKKLSSTPSLRKKRCKKIQNV